MVRVHYKRIVSFEGRNGMFKQGGLEVMCGAKEKIVSVFPLTSKGNIARGMVEIPLEAIDDVIRALTVSKMALKTGALE